MQKYVIGKQKKQGNLKQVIVFNAPSEAFEKVSKIAINIAKNTVSMAEVGVSEVAEKCVARCFRNQIKAAKS